MLDLALTDQAKMFNLINVGERAGSGLPRIRTVWQKQGWQEPKIVESFHPDRTTLLLPLAANKAAAKSGDKKVAAKSGGKPMIWIVDITIYLKKICSQKTKR